MMEADYCEGMDVTTIRSDTSARVSVAGDVDSETAPRLDHELSTLLSGGVTEIVLDASEVDFLSSAGLSVLISGHRSAALFRLERGNRVVDRLITLTGLEMLYGDSEIEASTE